MIKQAVAATVTLLALAALNVPSANAQNQQVMTSQGATGTFGDTSRRTNNFRLPNAGFTSNQRGTGANRMAGLGGLAQEIHGPTGRNGLPQTSLDSFVLNAGGSAEQIYGDEGASGIPPFFDFTNGHRINTGITGARDAGLTTGHGSYMPDAWGGDEFVKGPEWSQSGSNGGNPQYWTRGVSSGADPATPITTDPDPTPTPVQFVQGEPLPAPIPYRPVNNTPFGEGSAGTYRTNEGPTAPITTGDGGGG